MIGGLCAQSIAQDSDLIDRIAGSWILVDESLTFPDGRVIKSWGENPYGYLNFDRAAHFSQMMIRFDLPKFGTRTGGTPSQNEAVAKGMIAYYGTYADAGDGSSLLMNIVGSTFASFNGTISRRPLVFLTADEMIMHVNVPNSGVKTELISRRANRDATSFARG